MKAKYCGNLPKLFKFLYNVTIMDFITNLSSYLEPSKVESLLQSIEHGQTTHALLLNTDKLSDEEFVRRYPNVRKHKFVNHAYYYNKEEYEFGKTLLYDNGAISIQDASAMMAVYFLDPKEDDVILDICAAPGGKSIGASLAMNDKGIIVSNDISYPRAKAMSQNVERMGRGDIIVASNDFIFSHIHFSECFDKIILDAPCSGSAMFRKNGLVRDDWRYEKVKSNARKQLEIMELAYQMLKQGGTLAYSTCSFSKEEDEGTISSFLAAHPDATLVDLPQDSSFYRGTEHPEAVYLFPDAFDGEGQFIALIKKPGTLERTKKEIVGNERYHAFLEKYSLLERSNEMMRGKFYSLYQHFDVSHLNILRYGVKLFEMRDIYLPDHHLCHFLDHTYAIEINDNEMKAYIHGDTFPTTLADGFYIVSHDKMNLGFVKVTNGVAKNHYPKGLRRQL